MGDYLVLDPSKYGVTEESKIHTRSLADLEDYFAAMRPRLTVSEEVQEAVRFLRAPYGSDLLTKAGSMVVNRAATDLLPEWAKTLLGLRPRNPVTPLAARTAARALTRTLRYGVRHRRIEEAHARVGQKSMPSRSMPRSVS